MNESQHPEGLRAEVTVEAIRVGTSACLAGKEVRWDGTARTTAWLRDVLGAAVELVPVCPEVEVGMGVPREPVDLVRLSGATRMIAAETGRDWTGALEAWAGRRIGALPPLAGFVFKSRSPSCGLGSTPLRSRTGAELGRGDGLFAAAFRRLRPHVPAVEETALAGPGGRAHFVERVFAHARLQALLAGRFSVGRLVAFHAAHKYQLLAHAPARYRSLGTLVAGAKGRPAAEVKEAYARGFAAALAAEATAGRTVNALEHALGHLKRRLAPAERDAAALAITAFGAGRVPLLEPLAIVRHLARVHAEPYLLGQTLLFPDERELRLRSGA